MPVIGIDLGPYSYVLAAPAQAGRTAIIPNSHGEAVTPMAVYFAEDGSTVVGADAVRAGEVDPSRAVLDVRTRLGNRDWHIDVDGVSFGSIDVGGLVLKQAAADAEAVLGSLDGAVVAIPAHFHDEHRLAVRDALASAGVTLMRMVNEPAAAVLAYVLDADLGGTVLVYGLEDGALDVTLLSVTSADSIEVIAANGQTWGEPLDHQIAESETVIERVLKEARVKAKKVDAVVLAGSCASTPTARGLLHRMFSLEPLAYIDPAEVVARGAALQAGRLSPHGAPSCST